MNDGSRPRSGSSVFYNLLTEMAETHDKKSHDYASNENPYGNYHFAGQIAGLFAHSHKDAGFAGRLAEKIYRLANLESNKKSAQNESIEDTERDIAVITVLWMADRRSRRVISQGVNNLHNQIQEDAKAIAGGLVGPDIPYGSINPKEEERKMREANDMMNAIPQKQEPEITVLPEICIRCNVGDANTKINHAIEMHSATFNRDQLILNYKTKGLVLLNRAFMGWKP